MQLKFPASLRQNYLHRRRASFNPQVEYIYTSEVLHTKPKVNVLADAGKIPCNRSLGTIGKPHVGPKCMRAAGKFSSFLI